MVPIRLHLLLLLFLLSLLSPIPSVTASSMAQKLHSLLTELGKVEAQRSRNAIVAAYVQQLDDPAFLAQFQAETQRRMEHADALTELIGRDGSKNPDVGARLARLSPLAVEEAVGRLGYDPDEFVNYRVDAEGTTWFGNGALQRALDDVRGQLGEEAEGSLLGHASQVSHWFERGPGLLYAPKLRKVWLERLDRASEELFRRQQQVLMADAEAETRRRRGRGRGRGRNRGYQRQGYRQFPGHDRTPGLQGHGQPQPPGYGGHYSEPQQGHPQFATYEGDRVYHGHNVPLSRDRDRNRAGRGRGSQRFSDDGFHQGTSGQGYHWFSWCRPVNKGRPARPAMANRRTIR